MMGYNIMLILDNYGNCPKTINKRKNRKHSKFVSKS